MILKIIYDPFLRAGLAKQYEPTIDKLSELLPQIPITGYLVIGLSIICFMTSIAASGVR